MTAEPQRAYYLGTKPILNEQPLPFPYFEGEYINSGASTKQVKARQRSQINRRSYNIPNSFSKIKGGGEGGGLLFCNLQLTFIIFRKNECLVGFL